MVIVVTQEDIDNGQKFARNYCPIALAVKSRIRQHRKKLNPDDVQVTRTFVWITNKRSLLLPIKAREFIRAFDLGLPVQPFNFDLKIEL